MPVRFTSRAEGDLARGSRAIEARRRTVVDLPWHTVHQVHGAGVVIATGSPHDDVEADAIVTDVPGRAIAVQVADCAPVALVAEGVGGGRPGVGGGRSGVGGGRPGVGRGRSGVIGVVHAGWRGLAAGVVGAAVDAMRGLGAEAIRAEVGPCIHAGCYEFGAADLERVAMALGDEVRGRTRSGAPALDLPAGVRAALVAAGVHDIATSGTCTACSPDHWSHRARGDAERQAVVAWLR